MQDKRKIDLCKCRMENSSDSLKRLYKYKNADEVIADIKKYLKY